MNPSEFGFLTLGLALGITAGAVLLIVVRPRSPLRPVVRVTVTPHAMPPRDGIGAAGRGPARLGDYVPGSPDEDAHLDHAFALAAAPPAGQGPSPETVGDGTRVLSPSVSMPANAVGIPIAGAGLAAVGQLASARSGVAVADPPATSPRPSTAVHAEAHAPLDVGPAPELGVRARPPSLEPPPRLAPDAVGIPVIAAGRPHGEPPKPAVAATPRNASAALGACAEERGAAATACAAADAARGAARSIADSLRDAQRAHADSLFRVEEASQLADPRSLAADKERLHSLFKAAHAKAASADDAEGAARDWLTAVSAANTAARDAARRVQSGTEELRRQAAALERLDLEANAARIAAERAEDACRAARESLAACEERQRPAAPMSDEGANPLDAHWPGEPEPAFDRRSGGDVDANRLPLILWILRGDTAAHEQLVASLAADDASATAAWHVRIAKFVDAVTARAIEDGYLDADEAHPFWRLFSSEEQREIVQALSALGFRFDGMRGFDDDRVPSARDLSLAVGYAGIDRMRIRAWPGEAALAALFEGAVVRADLWLATQADDLSLARVEAALGPRAAGLAELWDAWGRARPAMLEER